MLEQHSFPPYPVSEDALRVRGQQAGRTGVRPSAGRYADPVRVPVRSPLGPTLCAGRCRHLGATARSGRQGVVVVVLLPLIGVILWYFLGPRTDAGS